MEWRWWGVCVEGGSINLREWVEWWCRGGYSTEGIRGCWSIVYADIDVVLCGMGMIVKYMSSSIRHFILLWVFSHFEPQQLIIVVILYYCRNEPKSQTLGYLIPLVVLSIIYTPARGIHGIPRGSQPRSGYSIYYQGMPTKRKSPSPPSLEWDAKCYNCFSPNSFRITPISETPGIHHSSNRIALPKAMDYPLIRNLDYVWYLSDSKILHLKCNK